MRTILFLTFFLTASVGYAQRDTSFMYTDSNLNQVKPALAKLIFKAYQKDSTSWVFLKYNDKKELLLKEVYGDPNLTIKHGVSVEYKYGKPFRKGIYVNNKKEGNFISYDTLGNTTDINFYKLDSLSGTSYSFWPSGKKMKEEIYGDKEQKLQRFLFYENGNIALKETFSKQGKLTDSAYLDVDGNPVEKTIVESPPKYPGGIQKFYELIGRNIKYAQDAAEANVQGYVHISFTITKEGNVTDVKVEKKLYPSLDNEAIRVVKLSQKWIPGSYFGQPVRVTYSIPIKFSISR